MSEALDLSTFVAHHDGAARIDLAVEGIACAACIRKIEGSLLRLPGVTAARLNFTNRRLAVEWRESELAASDLIGAIEDIGYRAHPFQPERAETEEARQTRWLMKCLAVAGFAAMNIMLLSVSVWSGAQRHDAGDARLLPLAVRADRAAGRGLCRPAVLPERLARAARAPAQHGRADLARRDARARHVAGRDGEPRRACLFRLRHHAAVLPVVRARPRPRDAAQDPRGRRQPGSAEGRVRASLRRRANSCVFPAAALQPGDRLLVRAGERVPADGVVLHRHVRDRRKPRHRRDRAPRGCGRRDAFMPAASISRAR